MNLTRLEKIGLGGLVFTCILTFVFVLTGLQAVYVAPFFMPWLVMILISLSNRQGKKNP